METDKVKEQYETFPYPYINPEDYKKESKNFLTSDITIINSLFWGGKKEINENFRVLDAGCGTGNAIIHLAEQLKDKNVEVIALDFSSASLNILKKRAEVKGLTNIKFINDSILNIPKLNLGNFDYIISAGVLHHLENPNEGIQILADSLKHDGGMCIMLYGKYGRIPIYMIQELLRMINQDEENKKIKIENTKEILNSLPKFNWWHFTGKQHLIDKTNDSEIYDIFLHSRDKPYTVPEIYQFLDSANLKMVRFDDAPMYNPKTYIKGKLIEKIKNKPKQEQEAIAELLHGRLKKHTFFTTKKDYNIPELSHENINLIPFLRSKIDLKNLRETETVWFRTEHLKIQTRFNKKQIAIINLIDKKKNIKEILEAASQQTGASYKELFEEWKKLWNVAERVFFILLNLP